ncbi:unnamed protein product [Adineta ricciae]|uniref:Uronyl 2-sulfotransferase-like protein n=1 Tax=Adineta ricciae TaxID=249248 RepID=A0A814NJA2_ADIRI|nr:unnamed protein product [Adineta ricciae]CAF1173905.1 unnamed protein product [Adineta ricciae]
MIFQLNSVNYEFAMSLRKTVRVTYRRMTTPSRTSRYWPILILIVIVYYIIYIYTAEQTVASDLDSSFHGNGMYGHLTGLKERRKVSSASGSIVKSDHRDPSYTKFSSDIRSRYSFIDLDDLDVNITILDEEHRSSSDVKVSPSFSNTHRFSHILSLKGDSSTIIYNRIPHSYDHTMRVLLEQVSTLHSFSYISSRISHPYAYNQSSLIHIGQSLTQHKFHQLIYDRSIYFFDCYHLKLPTQPIWINLVRDPISRVTSEFHAAREQCRTTNRCLVPKQTVNDTLDTCVSKWPPVKCLSAEFGVSQMIPFFCGLNHTNECQMNSTFALQQAKDNIEYYYTVVGVAELFYKFLYVLEKLLPQYFQLARLLFMNTRSSDRLIDERDTNVPLPNGKTRDILKRLLRDEYELYEYIRTRFYDQYRILTDTEW